MKSYDFLSIMAKNQVTQFLIHLNSLMKLNGFDY